MNPFLHGLSPTVVKFLVISAVALVGSQAAVLGLCTTGRCAASGLGPSMAFAAAVTIVAALMVRRR